MMDALAHEQLRTLFRHNDVTPIRRMAYDSDGNVQYIGYAMKGSASSDSAWRIFKLFYDSGNYSYELSSDINQIWDNRATSVTYE